VSLFGANDDYLH